MARVQPGAGGGHAALNNHTVSENRIRLLSHSKVFLRTKL